MHIQFIFQACGVWEFLLRVVYHSHNTLWEKGLKTDMNHSGSKVNVRSTVQVGSWVRRGCCQDDSVDDDRSLRGCTKGKIN